MATADHTTFTNVHAGGTETKRQPAQFRIRMGRSRRYQTDTLPEAPVKQYHLTGFIVTSIVICAAAYLLGLVLGSLMLP